MANRSTAYTTFKASDGEELVYQSYGEFGNSSKTIIILIHGFTGSSQYFTRNFDDLSQHALIIAPDLRGHGDSSKARHGYHVARIAADLKEMVESQLQPKYPDAAYIGVGCSLGAAVLWTYSELFDSRDFKAMVFVDQAPLQDYIHGSWSPEQGNYGVHDAATLAAAQRTLVDRPDDFYRGLVEGCLAYRFKPTEQEKGYSESEKSKDEEFFLNISRQGNPWWFSKLLANHTAYDHRDTIQNVIQCPCLVMASERSGSFPLAGLLETERLLKEGQHSTRAESVVCSSGHWMFYEDPATFNTALLKFCEDVLANQ